MPPTPDKDHQQRARLGRIFTCAIPWIVISGLWLSMLLVAPIGKPVLFDVDEGSVGMKGMLYQEGYRAFVDFWSDQPPLLYILLGQWFKCFGAGLWSGRFLVWFFSGILLISLYRAVADRSGKLAGLISILAIGCSMNFFRQSVSLMETIPSWALAMAAVAALGPPGQPRSLSRYLTSASLLALSMTIKLNTVLMVPGIMAELYLSTRTQGTSRACRSVMLWLAGWVGAFSLLAILWSFKLDQLFAVHSKAAWANTIGSEMAGFRRIPLFLLSNFPLVLIAGAGLMSCGRGLMREGILPMVWLAVTTIVLLTHNPVWWHYEFLVALPLGWLVAVTLQLWHKNGPRRITLAISLLLVVVVLPARMLTTAYFFRSPQCVMNEKIIKAFQDLRASGGRMVAVLRHQAYLVETGLISPPDLAVYSMKRMAAGELNEDRFIDTLDRWHPDAVLLTQSDLRPQLMVALSKAYRAESVAEGMTLFRSVKFSPNTLDWETFIWNTVLKTPYDLDAQAELAAILFARGRDVEAEARYRWALSTLNADIALKLAWLLASSTDPRVKNCSEAISLVERVMPMLMAAPDMEIMAEKIKTVCIEMTIP